MENKIVSAVLVLGIAATAFGSVSYANEVNSQSGVQNGSNIERSEKRIERQEKRDARFAQREARGAVIEKLVSGQSLTSEEETIKAEMLSRLQDDSVEHKEGSEIIEKILLGESLSSDEQAQFDTMQAEKAERKAQREAAQPIIDKKRAGETLTDAEQAVLDELKANRDQDGKGDRERGSRGERGNK